VNVIQRYLIVGLASASVPIALAGAPPASADCTNAGAATVCAQGTVRGGGPTAPTASYPSYCADDWYCGDDFGLDVIVNPGPPNRPILPGRPGGIGPR
jgi:hypothetical protein